MYMYIKLMGKIVLGDQLCMLIICCVGLTRIVSLMYFLVPVYCMLFHVSHKPHYIYVFTYAISICTHVDSMQTNDKWLFTVRWFKTGELVFCISD